LGVKVLQFKDLLREKALKRPIMKLDQHITYNFTSGTTGLPKGVVGTHEAAITQCIALKGHF
jgi:long-subunit acyl-CoA synthetase (AMP-forming)